jgi:hypothetical protein
MMKSVCTLLIAAFFGFVFAASAKPAADFPKGTFASKDAGGTEWTINFDGKGHNTVSRNGSAVVEGSYKVNKDTVEFKDVKGQFAEPDKIGTYKWKLTGTSLTFTKVKDEAKGRAESLTGGPWTIKK